jgi:hypothetical protein
VTALPRFAVVVLACASLAACGGSSDKSASEPPPPSTETSSPLSGTRETAPATAGRTLEGEAIALGDFRGRPVLVNVWSSW